MNAKSPASSATRATSRAKSGAKDAKSTATDAKDKAKDKTPGLDSLPLGSLGSAIGGFASALGSRAVDKVTEKAGSVSQRLTDFAEGTSNPATKAAAKGAESMAEGDSPLKAGIKSAATNVKEKVQGLFGGGGGGNKGKFKFNNIVEAIDVGAPIDVVFNAWTQYDGWPDFMKKVEKAELDEDENKVSFKGQVFWSHREWDTTITHQEPGKRIVWTSSGAKGHLSGTVTFHELAEDLTRIVLVVEYHPQGFMEKTGNIWRAVNRRLRLELKFFVRHVMTDVVLHPEDIEGYRAEIRDEEVVRTHDEVLDDEAAQAEQGDESSYDEEYDEQYDEAEEGEEPSDEEPYEEGEEPAAEGEEPTDEEPYDEDEEPYDEATDGEPADEYEEEPEEEPEERPRRTRARRTPSRTR